MGFEELLGAVEGAKTIGRKDVWNRAFFALHNYGANRPPAYPYDARNQQDHPKATILADDVGVLNFIAYANWMHNTIGFVLPFIGGKGGGQYGAHEDNRYPRCEGKVHAEYHRQMFEWFRTGVLSNGQILPDYLFPVAPWIMFGWGTDDWFGGPAGDKIETLYAVKAIPRFVRKFSWDQ